MNICKFGRNDTGSRRLAARWCCGSSFFALKKGMKKELRNVQLLFWLVCSRLLVNDVLEALACLEDGRTLRSDHDLGTVLGIHALALGMILHTEGAEAGESNALALRKGVRKGVQNSLDSSVSVLLRDAGLLSDGSNKLSLVHLVEIPPNFIFGRGLTKQ